ncbi:PAS domain S-box protein [candidate division KSB1 bacterium]|nr:PAS domain S-box protein [candidate division KSB1 bacterium]
MQFEEIKTLIVESPFASALLDSRGRIIVANDQFASFLDTPLQQIINHSLAPFVPGFHFIWPLWLDGINRRTIIFKKTVERLLWVWTQRVKIDQSLHVLAYASPCIGSNVLPVARSRIDDKGELSKRNRFLEQELQMMSVKNQQLQDVVQSETEKREQVECAHHENVTKYQIVVQSLQYALVLFNRDCRLDFINEFGAKKLLSTPRALVGKHIRELFLSQAARLQETDLTQVFNTGKSVDRIMEYTRRNQRVWISYSMQPIFDLNRKVNQVFLLGSDITEQILQEKELENHRHHLKEMVQRRTEELTEINQKLKAEIKERKRTEKLLTEAKALYQLLVENQRELITTTSPEGIITFASPSLCQFFQLDESQLIGKHFLPFIHSKDRQSAEQLHKYVLSSRDHAVVEQRVMSPNGGYKWLSWSCKTVTNEHNEPELVICVGRDVTQRKEIEEHLRESEARFREVIERSLDGYFFTDPDGNTLLANQAQRDLFGYVGDEIIGVKFRDVMAPESMEKAMKNFSQIKSGRPIVWTELECLRKDGSRFWVGLTARRVIKDGIVMGMEGFCKDITANRRAFERLSVSEAHFRALFENIPHQVFSLNKSGYFQEANHSFIQKWGDIKKKRPCDVFKENKVGEFLQQFFVEVDGTDHVSTSSFSFQVSDPPQLTYYSLSIRPVITKSGEFLGVIGLNIDVTHQVNALEQSKKLAGRVVQAQEEERARIAREVHDTIGQQLTALRLELQAVRSHLNQDPAKSEKQLNNAMLTVKASLATAQKMCYELRPSLLDDFGLESALRDHIHDFDTRWGISVYFQCEPLDNLLSPELETTLFRVVQESMNNVLKHAKAKKIFIRFWVRDDHLYLIVRDNGNGFDIESPKREKTDRLGLLGMKERIEMFSGKLLIHSWPGRGTRIFASVPIDEKA